MYSLRWPHSLCCLLASRLLTEVFGPCDCRAWCNRKLQERRLEQLCLERTNKMLEWVHVESLSPLRRMEYARDRLVSDFLSRDGWLGRVKAWLYMTYVSVQELSISAKTWSKAKYVLWAVTVTWLLVMGAYTILFAMNNPTQATYQVLLR